PRRSSGSTCSCATTSRRPRSGWAGASGASRCGGRASTASDAALKSPLPGVMMREPQPKTIHLKDYTPPAFRVETVDLDVDIRDEHAIVRSRLAIRRVGANAPLALDGDELSPI